MLPWAFLCTPVARAGKHPLGVCSQHSGWEIEHCQLPGYLPQLYPSFPPWFSRGNQDPHCVLTIASVFLLVLLSSDLPVNNIQLSFGYSWAFFQTSASFSCQGVFEAGSCERRRKDSRSFRRWGVLQSWCGLCRLCLMDVRVASHFGLLWTCCSGLSCTCLLMHTSESVPKVGFLIVHCWVLHHGTDMLSFLTNTQLFSKRVVAIYTPCSGKLQHLEMF